MRLQGQLKVICFSYWFSSEGVTLHGTILTMLIAFCVRLRNLIWCRDYNYFFSPRGKRGIMEGLLLQEATHLVISLRMSAVDRGKARIRTQKHGQM